MRVMVLTAGTKSLFWFRMDMMKSLVAAGHSVVAVGSDPERLWADEFAKASVRYRQMRVERTGTNPLSDLKTIGSIRALLREERPDVLFAFHGKGNIYGSFAARLEGLDEVYASVEGLGNVLAPSPANERDPRLVRAILKAEYRLALRSVRKVFFVNRENRDFFVRERLVSADKAVLTDGIGVNLGRFAFEPAAQNGVPTFLFLGRMLRAKGVLVFAEAARLARELYPGTPLRCIAIGPFDRNSELHGELAPYLEAGCLEYAGSHHDVRPFLKACDAVVLPSSYNEGLPKSLMEGMAVGRAIVTTDTVGCRETVEPGVNGLLMPPEDPIELAACLVELASDRDRLARMGAESRRIAERRFDVRRINARLFAEMGIPMGMGAGSDASTGEGAVEGADPAEGEPDDSAGSPRNSTKGGRA